MANGSRKLFFVPFYGEAILASEAWLVLTDRQRVSFINLYWRCWVSENPGHLENDDEILWKLAGSKNKKQWLIDKAALLRHAFKLTADSVYLYREDLLALWPKQRQIADTNHLRAKKGGEARSKKAHLEQSSRSSQACSEAANQNLNLDSKPNAIPRSPLRDVEIRCLTTIWRSAQQALKTDLPFEEYETCIRDTEISCLDDECVIHLVATDRSAAALLTRLEAKILQYFPSSIRGLKADIEGLA